MTLATASVPQTGLQPRLSPARLAALGRAFCTEVPPSPLRDPHWVGRSRRLAAELGLDARAWFESDAALSLLSGGAQPEGVPTLATVYSGHQFGVWAGQLGDGRALLLGEVDTLQGPREFQLKGAGLTPFSRMGDGRAVLRSSIREFLCSEAMHGLGIPTTRALCVTGSPAPVIREEVETAAVVTRVAPSFIRFGHFEHFCHHGQPEALRQLADHVIERFYPECLVPASGASGPNRYARFLGAVVERTARLIAQWQAVGFCHGVMNTDNMSILGLTIDYGPFQFLDAFDPGHICNHSDGQGRYAYNRQPQVAYWNLACLAQALMPLIESEEHAVAALEPYRRQFPAALDACMQAKLGIDTAAVTSAELRSADQDRLEALLQLLARGRVDYTIFWRRLCDAVEAGEPGTARDLFLDRASFDAWWAGYAQRLAQEAQARGLAPADLARAMRQVNPRFVLRNHMAETAIRRARLGDFTEVQRLLDVLHSPHDEHPGHDDLAGFPPDWASQLEVSCSS